jgi:hypothetical protein
MSEKLEVFLKELTRQIKHYNIMRYAEIQIKILESHLTVESQQKMINTLDELIKF